MTGEELRLEALRLAQRNAPGSTAKEIVADAEKFMAFLKKEKGGVK